MSHCPPLEELSALIDGDLSPRRELEIRWHLDICRTCACYADTVVGLKRAVGRAHDREIPSPAFRRSVMARVPKRRRGRQWRAGAVAAPLFIAAEALLFCFQASALCADPVRQIRMHRAIGRPSIVAHQWLRPEELLSMAESF
jgi:anti-sigma factor RsiW